MYKMPKQLMYGSLNNITKLVSPNDKGNITRKDRMNNPEEPGREAVQPSPIPSSFTVSTFKPKTHRRKEKHSNQLQEAIIWSEIIGKPVCKRRKRSYYGSD